MVQRRGAPRVKGRERGLLPGVGAEWGAAGGAEWGAARGAATEVLLGPYRVGQKQTGMRVGPFFDVVRIV